MTSATPDPELVRRADAALRAALREGLGSDPDVERLQSFVVAHRIQLRRDKARASVKDALAEIRRRGVIL